MSGGTTFKKAETQNENMNFFEDNGIEELDLGDDIGELISGQEEELQEYSFNDSYDMDDSINVDKSIPLTLN